MAQSSAWKKAAKAGIIPPYFIFKFLQFFCTVFPRVIRLNPNLLVIALEGGFGHSVVTPDILRRNESSEVLYFYFAGQFKNSRLPLLWRGPVNMVQFNYYEELNLWGRKIQFILPMNSRLFFSFLLRVILFCKVLLFRGRTLKTHFEIDYTEMYIKSVCFDLEKNPGFPKDVNRQNELVSKRYMGELQKREDKILLPQRIRKPFLSKIRPVEGSKTICFYMRKKGGPESPTSFSRSGSEADVYNKTIRYLLEAGFTIWIIGDRKLSTEIRQLGANRIHECSDFPGNEEIVNILFGTECDFFIGDPGGGFWLSCLNNIPTLMINIWPHYTAFPNIQNYYRSFADLQGAPRSLYDLILMNPKKYFVTNPPDTLFSVMNEDEIYQAVSSFIDDPYFVNQTSQKFNEELKEKFPIWAMNVHRDFKFNRAYLNKWKKGSAPETKNEIK